MEPTAQFKKNKHINLMLIFDRDDNNIYTDRQFFLNTSLYGQNKKGLIIRGTSYRFWGPQNRVFNYKLKNRFLRS